MFLTELIVEFLRSSRRLNFFSHLRDKMPPSVTGLYSRLNIILAPHGHRLPILCVIMSVIGAHGAGVTPVTIPNTEVKPSIGENTALREGSTVPNFIEASE